MHVDAPIANLVVDKLLFEDRCLLETGKPQHRAPVDTVERLEDPVVTVPNVVQFPSHRLDEAMVVQ